MNPYAFVISIAKRAYKTCEETLNCSAELKNKLSSRFANHDNLPSGERFSFDTEQEMENKHKVSFSPMFGNAEGINARNQKKAESIFDRLSKFLSSFMSNKPGQKVSEEKSNFFSSK